MSYRYVGFPEAVGGCQEREVHSDGDWSQFGIMKKIIERGGRNQATEFVYCTVSTHPVVQLSL